VAPLEVAVTMANLLGRTQQRLEGDVRGEAQTQRLA
jgi:hypothetical protein